MPPETKIPWPKHANHENGRAEGTIGKCRLTGVRNGLLCTCACMWALTHMCSWQPCSQWLRSQALESVKRVETPALPSNSYVTLSKWFNLSASVSTSVKRGNGRMRFLLGVVRTQQGDTYSAQKQAPDKVMMATCGWRETWGTCAGNVRPGGLWWGRESCRGATAAGLAMALPWRGKASGSHVQEERGRWVQEEGQSWE